MGRHTETGTTRRRAAGVVVGLVIAAGVAGAGPAFAADAPLGCPSGYTLSGDTCRNGSGGTTFGLPMLPGDVDPVTGRVLVPAVDTTEPVPTTTTAPPVPTTTTTTTSPPVTTTTTTAPPVVPTTTTAPVVPTTTTAPVVPTTTTTVPVVPTTTTTTAPPVVPTTTTPPVVVLPSTTPPQPVPPQPVPPQPCLLPGRAADPAAVARTQAAVDRARALFVADVVRRASAATLRADAVSLASAYGAHAQAMAAQRPCATR